MPRPKPRALPKSRKRPAPKPPARRTLPKKRSTLSAAHKYFLGVSRRYCVAVETAHLVLGVTDYTLQIRAKEGSELPSADALPEGFQLRKEGVYAKQYGVGFGSADLAARLDALAGHRLFKGGTRFELPVEAQSSVEIPTAR